MKLSESLLAGSCQDVIHTVVLSVAMYELIYIYSGYMYTFLDSLSLCVFLLYQFISSALK